MKFGKRLNRVAIPLNAEEEGMFQKIFIYTWPKKDLDGIR